MMPFKCAGCDSYIFFEPKYTKDGKNYCKRCIGEKEKNPEPIVITNKGEGGAE